MRTRIQEFDWERDFKLRQVNMSASGMVFIAPENVHHELIVGKSITFEADLMNEILSFDGTVLRIDFANDK